MTTLTTVKNRLDKLPERQQPQPPFVVVNDLGQVVWPEGSSIPEGAYKAYHAAANPNLWDGDK